MKRPFSEHSAVHSEHSEPAHAKMPHKKAPVTAPERLKLLLVVVNRDKEEFYTDLLQGYAINFQLYMTGQGTADIETLHYLGLAESPKAVIFAAVREDRAAAVMEVLNNKFRTIRGGNGIACTVPMTGTVGVSVYRFLADNRK